MMLGDATTGTGTTATGSSSTSAAAASAPSLTSGLYTWQNPGAAFTDIQGIVSDPTTAFNSTNLQFTLGLLAIPAVLLLLLMGGKR